MKVGSGVLALAYSAVLKMEVIYSFDTTVDFSELHGSVSQKTELLTASICIVQCKALMACTSAEWRCTSTHS